MLLPPFCRGDAARPCRQPLRRDITPARYCCCLFATIAAAALMPDDARDIIHARHAPRALRR